VSFANSNHEDYQIYAAATFLNPTERLDFFDANWIKGLQPWIPVMERHCRELWECEYSHLANKEDRTQPIDAFEAWRNRMRNSEQLPGDEFSRYCPRRAGTATIGSKAINLIAWWDILGQQFPSIRQWALISYLVRQRPANASEHSAVQKDSLRLIGTPSVTTLSRLWNA
jgi:hypothetical protein